MHAHLPPMARIHPQTLSSSSSSSSLKSTNREVFTIWMKSLVLNGNGCTVYDASGRLVYRVDNYDCKCSDVVYFMDSCGKILLKILRKKLRVFGEWHGFRCSGAETEEKKPWFAVRKAHRILKKDDTCRSIAAVDCGRDGERVAYKINGSRNKSCYKITDITGDLAAEVKRKETASGIVMGHDVLSLVIEPSVDQLLVMGLVVVCGLINHTM